MTDDTGIRSTTTLIANAVPWIDDRLADAGIARTGPVGDTRVRSWASVTTVPTDQGTIWFKAASAVTAHEIRLYPLLVSVAPDLVLHPIATDPERAWILLPDGGTSLQHAVSGDDLLEHLVGVVPRYAGLQRTMMPHATAMLGMGVPNMRPARLPGLFDEAIAHAMMLARDLGVSGDVDAMKEVASLRPRYLEWCDRLDGSPIQPAIDHSDLHANNMLVPEHPAGVVRIYDWGDSVLAHPFSTLLVLIRSLMDRLGTTLDDPRLYRVRDAYLEPFSDLAGPAELVEMADIACWTSIVIRAVTWMRVLELGPPPNPEWATAPMEWMKTLLNDSWLE